MVAMDDDVDNYKFGLNIDKTSLNREKEYDIELFMISK
jgi:hypothetical protein